MVYTNSMLTLVKDVLPVDDRAEITRTQLVDDELGHKMVEQIGIQEHEQRGT